MRKNIFVFTTFSISERLLVFGLIAIYFLSFISVFSVPLVPMYWQWADDALYFNNARQIVAGLWHLPWLGPFNEIVLSKAPLFPVFLSLTHMIGVPLRVAEFILFCPLPILFWRAIRPLGLSKFSVLYLAALVLLFIPTIGYGSRLLRETLFGAMSLYALIALSALVVGCIDSHRSKNFATWPWAILAGTSIGLASVTREEATWLLVPAVFTILLYVYSAISSRRIAGLVCCILPMLASYSIPGIVFSTLNYFSYGVSAPSLRQHKDFKSLYSVLVSLEPETRHRYVPIITATRESAYRHSKHFAELRPFLEGEALGKMATNKGHMRMNDWPHLDQKEFFVSNFEFALAKAIVLSGRNNGSDFLAFCRAATTELEKAVMQGFLDSGRGGVALMPPITPENYLPIIEGTIKSVLLLFTQVDKLRRVNRSNIGDDRVLILDWHSFLKTWPVVPHTGDSVVFSDLVFNNFLVKKLKYLYFPVAVLGLILLLVFARRNLRAAAPYIFLWIISCLSIGSFSGVMGILNEVGWPALRWANGYNAMGYYPMHFLLLINFVIILAVVGHIRNRARIGS